MGYLSARSGPLYSANHCRPQRESHSCFQLKSCCPTTERWVFYTPLLFCIPFPTSHGVWSFGHYFHGTTSFEADQYSEFQISTETSDEKEPIRTRNLLMVSYGVLTGFPPISFPPISFPIDLRKVHMETIRFIWFTGKPTIQDAENNSLVLGIRG
jgi:hypothetical protein